MTEVKAELRPGERATILVGEDPLEAKAEARAGIAPGMVPQARPSPFTARVYDAATLAGSRLIEDVPFDEWTEDQLEGPDLTDYHYVDLRRQYQQRLLERDYTLVSGETVPASYPLQCDGPTAATDTTLSLEGDRGRTDVALAEASSSWVPPQPVAEQRATIERLESDPARRPMTNNHGLEEWSKLLDAREKRRFHPSIGDRFNREGTVIARAWPEPKRLEIASPWAYEPWCLGDQRRYLATHDDVPEGEEIDQDVVRLARGRALDCDLYLCPQVQKVRFEWLTVYAVSAGWWSFTIFLPNVRTMRMRAAIFPETFRPKGINPSSNPTDYAQSIRISRSSTYAEAILDDTRLAQEAAGFELDFRFQGRFGIYQLEHDAGAFCAQLRINWPGEREIVNVFRRPGVTIERERLLLQVDGLITQEVFPWSTYLETVPGGGLGTGQTATSLADGY